MKLRHSHAILLSALVWMGIGTLLLIKGLQYLTLMGNKVLSGTHQGFSLIQQAGRLTSHSEQGAMIVVVAALLLGFFKGRIILKKTVHRTVSRIKSHPSPVPITSIYSKGYLFLIGGMMCLGFIFKILPLPLDVKGFIDLTIGVALTNGGMLYIRALFA